MFDRNLDLSTGNALLRSNMLPAAHGPESGPTLKTDAPGSVGPGIRRRS